MIIPKSVQVPYIRDIFDSLPKGKEVIIIQDSVSVDVHNFAAQREENVMFQVTPDWSITATAKQIEEQLEGFQFAGPGLYLTKTDTIFLVPIVCNAQNVWFQSRPEEALYHVHVFNSPLEQTIFAVVGRIPTRLDKRDDPDEEDPPTNCQVCGEPTLGSLNVCYDHAKRGPTGEPRSATNDEIIQMLRGKLMADEPPIQPDHSDEERKDQASNW